MSRKTRKLIWSVPLIAAVAVIGALAAFMTLTPNQAQADGAPGAVTGVAGTADGRSTVNLTWTAPSTGTVTGYRIDRSDDARVWELIEDDTDSTTTSYQDTGLKASTIYNYRVYALNGDHTGPVSIEPIYATVTTGPAAKPGQVTGLTATRDLAKKITLTWNQPADNGGSPVTRYCVQVRQVTPPGASAALAAEACETGSVSTPTQIAAIAVLVSTVDGSGSADVVVVTASSVEADGGTASWTHMGTGTTLFGDGVEVEYRVTAVNARGRAENSSNPAEGKTKETAAPGTPMNIKLVGVSSDGVAANTVYVYWNEPGGLTGTTMKRVQRQVWAATIGWTPATWTDPADAMNDVPPRDTDLANHAQLVDVGSEVDVAEGRVRYRVRYEDGNTSGPWAYSQELEMPFPQFEGEPNVASLPVITADPANLRVVDDYKHFNRIDLRWAREQFCFVGGDTTGDADALCDETKTTSTYAIDVSSDSTAPAIGGEDLKWNRATLTISFSETLYVHLSNSFRDDATKLVSDSTRHYRVFPWYGNRYGFPEVVTGHTKLASPPGGIAQGGLRVTADGEIKLKLDWDAPASDGGSPVTNYLIQVSIDRDNDTNLDNNIFASWCDVAVRKASDARMYTYDGKIASTGKPNCFGSVPPLASTGEKLQGGYARWFRVIPLNKKSNKLPDTVTDGWMIGTTEDLPTLANGMLYQSSIDTAVAARGLTGSAMAPGVPIGLVAETAKNVHSLLTTQKGVLLTWDKPGTGSVTAYEIQRQVDGGDWMTLKDDASPASTDYTDPRIPLATEEFVYRVAAKNQFGNSAWSNMAYFSSTTMTAPGHTHEPVVGPEVGPATSVTPGPFNAGGTIQVSWDAAPNATGYIIYAVNVDELDDANGQIVVAPVNDAAAETFNLGGLDSGDTYDIYVVATAKEMVAWPASADVVQVEAE